MELVANEEHSGSGKFIALVVDNSGILNAVFDREPEIATPEGFKGSLSPIDKYANLVFVYLGHQ